MIRTGRVRWLAKGELLPELRNETPLREVYMTFLRARSHAKIRAVRRGWAWVVRAVGIEVLRTARTGMLRTVPVVLGRLKEPSEPPALPTSP